MIRSAFAFLLLSSLASAADVAVSSSPAVEVSSAPACRLPEVKPLLLKARYNPVRYRRNVLSQKPLTLEERLWLEPGRLLLLEQKACDEFSARFEFARKEDDTDPFSLRLSSAAAALRGLYVNPDATLDSKVLERIAQAMETEAAVKREGPPAAEVVACLEKGKKGCRVELKLSLVDTKLTVLYVDRP